MVMPLKVKSRDGEKITVNTCIFGMLVYADCSFGINQSVR